jgi:hypothetical protein
MGLWEWSHEINAPHIKYFYLKVVVEGHCIPSCDVPLILALPAPPNEFFGVVIHGWPIESTLPYLGLCAKHSIMALYGAAWHFSMICHPSAMGTHLLSRPSKHTRYR